MLKYYTTVWHGWFVAERSRVQSLQPPVNQQELVILTLIETNYSYAELVGDMTGLNDSSL